MDRTKQFILFLLLILATTLADAQIEVAHLRTKGFHSTGFGGFLNFAVPVSDGDAITIDAGAYFFKHNDNRIVIVPMLLGYRHTFDGSGTGLYVEPTAGYTIGGSDIQKYSESGSIEVDDDGNIRDQKVKGITAGLIGGYIFPEIPLNIGLRYEHVLVGNDPSLNLFSLRLSHTISFGRREY